MGDIGKNNRSGVGAEYTARGFLTHYFDVGKLSPDPGMDFIAIGPYRRFNHLCPIVFQVKGATRFTMKSGILMNWLRSIHAIPVILLRMEKISSSSVRYSFRVLHDWMLDNPDWAVSLPLQKSKDISPDEFTQKDEDDGNFLAAVESEISRVVRNGRSAWSTRQWRGLPITEPEMFSHFGRLNRLELDAATLDELATADGASCQEEQWSMIRGDSQGAPLVTFSSLAEWRDKLSISVPAPEIMTDLAAFQRFVCAMRSFSSGSDFELPPTNWRGISPWRTFCQMYPRSLNMLSAFLTRPGRCKESCERLGAAFILVSTLANTEDNVLAEQARKTLARVREDFSVGLAANYEDYAVMATYYAACCEAGLSSVGDRCVDFHRRHDEEWQVQWQRDYYRSDDLVSARIAHQKLTHPNLRHRKTHDLEEWRLGLLRRRGVDISV